MENIHQPHDKLFKKSFGKKLVTRDFLLNRLPKEVVAKIDLSKIERQNTSFISEGMKSFYTDMVYRCPVNGKNANSYLYFLKEFEKSKDSNRLLPLRILEYDLAIIRHDVDEQMAAGRRVDDIKLPAIINFVLYADKKEYRQARSIIDAFADPELARMMFESSFLIPLRKQSRESILKDGKAALAELILSQEHNTDFCELLSKDPQLMELLNQSSYAKTSLLYIMDRDPHDVSEVLKKLPNLDRKIKQEVMSGLQRMLSATEQKGIEIGILQGREEGMKEGREEGMKEKR